MLNGFHTVYLASTVDQGAEAAAKQKDSGFPFKASILTKDATGGPARSPSLLCMKGLLVESQVPLESVSRRRKEGESAFLKDTFICPLKTGQFNRCHLQCKPAWGTLSLPRVCTVWMLYMATCKGEHSWLERKQSRVCDETRPSKT